MEYAQPLNSILNEGEIESSGSPCFLIEVIRGTLTNKTNKKKSEFNFFYNLIFFTNTGIFFYLIMCLVMDLGPNRLYICPM